MSASTTLQKRLYTVLPRGVTQAAAAASSSSRVRSNSASSSRSLYTAATPTGLTGGFFDAAPQPPPGRSQLAVSRLPIEGRGEVEGPPSPTHHHGNGQQSSNSSHGPAPPSSIALTSPPANGSSPFAAPSSGPFFPYPPFSPPPAPSATAPLDAHAHPTAAGKRAHRHKYHFDVGAYGIPKRSRTVVSGRDGHGGARSRQTDALDLAVNVGEDAYFVRENAMGVADGVGGWSRNREYLHFAQSICVYPPPSHAPLLLGGYTTLSVLVWEAPCAVLILSVRLPTPSSDGAGQFPARGVLRRLPCFSRPMTAAPV